jgi:hypothetical protein
MAPLYQAPKATPQALTEALNEIQREMGGGFFYVHDQVKGNICAGWIKEIKVKGNGAKVELGLVVNKREGQRKWDFLNDFTFIIDRLSQILATPYTGGFQCSDPSGQQPAFKIFPRSAVPPQFNRDFGGLVCLGNYFQEKNR